MLQNENKNFYEESSSVGVIHKFSILKTIYKNTSEFQDVEIVDTEAYGRLLLLDSQVQSSALDESTYHESLVHPALFSHECPKRVFIGGGGEGATAREVLKHKEVEHCVMADLDELVCKSSKEHLLSWHKGSFEDKRLTLVLDDARKALESYPDEYFDIIILDLCDPMDYGPCYKLYSTEFYSVCLKKLTLNGVFVTQSGPASLNSCKDVFTPVTRTLKQIFPRVFPYSVHIPSFTNIWGFILAYKSSKTKSCLSNIDVESSSITEIDDVIFKRLLENVSLEHYDGESHKNMFTLSKTIRKLLDNDQRVICEKTPIYVSYIDCKKE